MSENSVNAPKKPIEEFVGYDGSIISGDRTPTNDSEIETGPVEKPFNDDSDYEKGMPVTSDRAGRYLQRIPWFAVYSYGANNGLNKGVYESKKLTKRQLEEQIQEDLVKKDKKSDLIDKNSGKVKEIIDLISDTDLDIEQIEKLKELIGKMKEKSGITTQDLSKLKKALENKTK